MINYFIHDVNAASDSKLIRLRAKHKSAGYGVYWLLLEALAASPDGMLELDFNLLGFQLNSGCDAALIKSVITEFGLFQFTEDNRHFYSVRLNETIHAVHAKSEKARIAGIKSGEKRQKSSVCLTPLKQDMNNRLADVQQTFNIPSTDVQQSKVDKSKEDNTKENNIIPSLSPQKDKSAVKKPKPQKHFYGEYKNVALSDIELEKLKIEFPNDWQKRIENVSAYCKSHGKSYSDYLATIRNWARKDINKPQTSVSSKRLDSKTEFDIVSSFANS